MKVNIKDFQKRMIEELMSMEIEDMVSTINNPSFGRLETQEQAQQMNPDMYAALTAADAAPVGTVAVTKVGDQMVVATKSAAYISNVGG